jgi:hypothetical protein
VQTFSILSIHHFTQDAIRDRYFRGQRIGHLDGDLGRYEISSAITWHRWVSRSVSGIPSRAALAAVFREVEPAIRITTPFNAPAAYRINCLDDNPNAALRRSE